MSDTPVYANKETSRRCTIVKVDKELVKVEYVNTGQTSWFHKEHFLKVFEQE
jgi:hypothetical protein